MSQSTGTQTFIDKQIDKIQQLQSHLFHTALSSALQVFDMPTNNPLQHMPQPGRLPGSRPDLMDAITSNTGCNSTHSTALPVGHSCCAFNSSSACSIGNNIPGAPRPSEGVQEMPEMCAFGAGDNVELVAALCQQLADGCRCLLWKLPRHHRALHRTANPLPSQPDSLTMRAT